MLNSINFGKTLQIKQYEPISSSASINDITEELWSDRDTLDNLSKLLVVQVYKILGHAARLEKLLAETDSWKNLLDNMENQLCEDLNAKGFKISITVNKE